MIIASLYHCPFDDGQLAHDMSVSIITKDKIYAYEEEKLTSTKNECTVKFPERSLVAGCKELNIELSDVTDWVFPIPSKKVRIEEFKLFFCDLLKAKKFKSWQDLKIWTKKHVHYVPHHISHASLAFYTSKFKDAAFLTKDGGGDLGDTRGFVFGEFNNNKIIIKNQNYNFRNLSLFHDYLTDSLGFSYFSNGKTSGLASYGKVITALKSKFKNLLKVTDKGITFSNKRFKNSKTRFDKFNSSAYERYKVFRSYPGDTNILRLSASYLKVDIAATGEQVLKEKIYELLKILKKKTKMENLVCSGGLFQNVSLNYFIINSGIFKNYYFPMANSDAGLSLGAALFIKHSLKRIKKSNIDFNPYLGPSFSKQEIKKELDLFRLNYKYLDKNFEKKIANLIANGSIVGWFQGKGEFGPRSLGNRSILADPRRLSSKTKVNQLLKKRDWFMPFAPSMHNTFAKKITGSKFFSGYMQVAFNINKKFSTNIKSAIHHDNTSRIHMVKKEQNSKYWKLLNEIKKVIGIPVILNTSFNRHGIATIASPRQAIEHAMEGCMDYLAIDNFLIKVTENRKFKTIVKKTISENKNLINDETNRLLYLKKNKVKFNQSIFLKALSALKK
jgi:carbamoyltransferase